MDAPARKILRTALVLFLIAGFADESKDIGLPESELPTTLLTFNLGIEAAQMAIVLATINMLGLFRHCPPEIEQSAVEIVT